MNLGASGVHPPLPHALPGLQIHSWGLRTSTHLARHHRRNQGQGFALVLRAEQTCKARGGGGGEEEGVVHKGTAELKP